MQSTDRPAGDAARAIASPAESGNAVTNSYAREDRSVGHYAHDRNHSPGAATNAVGRA
jgi:hypothetical protein